MKILYQKKINQLAKDVLDFEHKSFEELKTVIAQKSKKALHEVDAHRALVVLGGIKLLFWDRGYDEEYEKLADKEEKLAR